MTENDEITPVRTRMRRPKLDQVEQEPLFQMPEALKVGQYKEHHLIIRTIVPPIERNPEAAMFAVEEVDAYLNSFLRNGWTLFATHYISSGKTGQHHTIAWILVR